MEIWGGMECTVNRVGDAFHNQLAFSGHDRRVDDLERFAALGIRRMRYPVIWELTSPDRANQFDWRWADERLSRLRDLNVDPIVGLLHHGSGPRYTNLLDARFPELFANYAYAVAERFPWVDHYTPINEPLTTARFSALYGHWYPHARDNRSFVRALLNQCRATVLAMAAMRRINPAAKLIQTDDLGYTSSTPRLAYQAAFDNERRWLGWDLLCGSIGPDHALWDYLLSSGASEEELDWFKEHRCPPDIIGVNHYVTSDRHLDENLQNFPEWTWGGNDIERYADVEAVRGRVEEYLGIGAALSAAWARYRLPIAITETHLGGRREDQLRWVQEFWFATRQAREEGIDLRAMTLWALLGSFDWSSLVTRLQGHYEPGAFDVRGQEPRPTAIARLLMELARGDDPVDRALIEQPGWWRRPSRVLPTVAAAQRSTPVLESRLTRKYHRPLLVTGATGTLGQAFARICELRGLDTAVRKRTEMDICDRASIERALDETRPWAVVNAAGYVRVDDAEHECARCYRENSGGAALLASACAERNIPFVTFSSDLVFDGRSERPYVESHEAAPLNVYGLSKVRAERAVLKAHPNALVVRTSAFFGPWDEHNFVTLALRALRSGQAFTAIDDIVVSPTYVPDLVNASLDLLIDGEHGLWHLVNDGCLTWIELARRAAKLARVRTDRLCSSSWRELDLKARRPQYSAMSSERGRVMPALDDALERYSGAR